MQGEHATEVAVCLVTSDVHKSASIYGAHVWSRRRNYPTEEKDCLPQDLFQLLRAWSNHAAENISTPCGNWLHTTSPILVFPSKGGLADRRGEIKTRSWSIASYFETIHALEAEDLTMSGGIADKESIWQRSFPDALRGLLNNLQAFASFSNKLWMHPHETRFQNCNIAAKLSPQHRHRQFVYDHHH